MNKNTSRNDSRNDSQSESHNGSQFLQGMKAGIPVIFGFITAGMAFGVLARQATLTPLQTLCMSIFVYAGASQMLAAGLLMQGAGIFSIVLATFIINLRHLIMSTCVAEKLPTLSVPKKLVSAWGITDESFGIFTTAPKENNNFPFLLGIILVSYPSWCLGSFLGAVTVDLLPPIITASMNIALYAMFISLVVPGASKSWRLTLLVVFTAICNSILVRYMASSWAIIASTLIGAAVGVFWMPNEEEDAE